ncbi:putative bifunctional diguanylate cyclase/phosphodiesterase [Planobispora rosea]|uniref:putative bifunctional diguanylate cyclase/phosphodiesterase n=1 Tax=Planobispora rosea TaxID=35762 RepID=UPI00083A7AE3|nr:EAL domain-containing protein [Planobispora rosea]
MTQQKSQPLISKGWQWAAVALGGIYLLFMGVLLPLTVNGGSLRQVINVFVPGLALFTLVGAIAAIRASLHSQLGRRTRHAWRWMAAANVLLALMIPSSVVIPVSSFPSVPDALRLASVPLLVVGILLLPRSGESRSRRWTFALDAAVVVVAAAIPLWYFQLGPTLAAEVVDPRRVAAAAAYPIFDLLALFAVVVALLRGVDPRVRRPMWLAAAAIVHSTIGDTYLGYLNSHSADQSWFSWQFPFWLTAHFLLALSATEQCRRIHGPARVRPSQALRKVSRLPYLAVVLGFGMLLTVAVNEGSLYSWGGVAVGASVLVVLVLARQLLAQHDNHTLATTDSLTGLANRAFAMDRTAQTLAGATTGQGNVAMALIDLDDFKAVNDRLGHAVGDALLVAVADRLRACVRPGDTVARLGGDEFAVLLPDLAAEHTGNLAERIISALKTPVRVGGHELIVQASIGLAGGDGAMSTSELLRRADVAMYAAKEQGKNRWARYADDMDVRANEHARLGSELRQALKENQFFLLYQPVVALPGGGVSGVEALIRWRHPERGLVSPAEFIPISERNGMITEIGAWALREACSQMVAWQREYGPTAPGKMSVNVSARQLHESAFVTTVADVLRETGLDPADLLLEITETAVFDGGAALETVRAIHALGVSIALDDFGTGHSSLSLLRTCPVDVLKVDKSFIDGVTGTAEQSAIATAMAQIAQVMRLNVVAEGVETEAQAERLHQLGYPLAQGFHFARPLPPQDVENLLIIQVDNRGRPELTARAS